MSGFRPAKMGKRDDGPLVKRSQSRMAVENPRAESHGRSALSGATELVLCALGFGGAGKGNGTEDGTARVMKL